MRLIPPRGWFKNKDLVKIASIRVKSHGESLIQGSAIAFKSRPPAKKYDVALE